MSQQQWQRYLQSLREAPKRGSVAGIRRSMNALLDTGGQTEGSPYEEEDNEKPRLKGKRSRNQVSPPPGAEGGGSIGAPGPAVGGGSLEEEVEPESFEKHSYLNPDFWDESNNLKPKIARRLMKIAKRFLEGLELPVRHAAGEGLMTALVEDVRFTGSLANYNWSKYSDIDLHIVVDFSKIDENVELVKGFFDAARMRWNDLHDITINGAEVEIYVENVGDVHHSSGLYSIMEMRWIVEPSAERITFDYASARAKADNILTQINLIERILDESHKARAALRSIERLKQKIRTMRKAGLNSPAQEYSAENIAFKILRREGALDKLDEMKYTAYDLIMSME